MRTWRSAFVGLLVAVAVIAGWSAASGAPQRTDAERIADLESRVAILETNLGQVYDRVGALEQVRVVPAVAPASEVWNGSFLLFDPEVAGDYVYYQYCKIAPYGMTMANQYELQCMVIDPNK